MAEVQNVLLVDGYNMIGGWPELARLADIDMDEARNRLLERLADFQAFTGWDVIAVFDAYLVPGLGKAFKHRKLQIYFTKEKETADECIERLVGEMSARRRQIYVATSDMIEQHVIFGQGALRLSARELDNMLQQNEKALKSRIAEESAKPGRNTLAAKLSPEVRKLFERWRRE